MKKKIFSSLQDIGNLPGHGPSNEKYRSMNFEKREKSNKKGTVGMDGERQHKFTQKKIIWRTWKVEIWYVIRARGELESTVTLRVFDKGYLCRGSDEAGEIMIMRPTSYVQSECYAPHSSIAWFLRPFLTNPLFRFVNNIFSWRVRWKQSFKRPQREHKKNFCVMFVASFQVII